MNGTSIIVFIHTYIFVLDTAYWVIPSSIFLRLPKAFLNRNPLVERLNSTQNLNMFLLPSRTKLHRGFAWKGWPSVGLDPLMLKSTKLELYGFHSMSSESMDTSCCWSGNFSCFSIGSCLWGGGGLLQDPSAHEDQRDTMLDRLQLIRNLLHSSPRAFMTTHSMDRDLITHFDQFSHILPQFLNPLVSRIQQWSQNSGSWGRMSPLFQRGTSVLSLHSYHVWANFICARVDQLLIFGMVNPPLIANLYIHKYIIMGI